MILSARWLRSVGVAVALAGLSACDPTGLTNRRDPATTAPIQPELPIAADRFEVHVLTASWCGYCQQVPPLLEKLRAEFPTVAFREYDIDAPGNSKLTSLYGAQGYPCFVVLDAGQVIEKHKGLQKFDPFSAHLRKKLTHASAPRW